MQTPYSIVFGSKTFLDQIIDYISELKKIASSTIMVEIQYLILCHSILRDKGRRSRTDDSY